MSGHPWRCACGASGQYGGAAQLALHRNVSCPLNPATAERPTIVEVPAAREYVAITSAQNHGVPERALPADATRADIAEALDAAAAEHAQQGWSSVTLRAWRVSAGGTYSLITERAYQHTGFEAGAL